MDKITDPKLTEYDLDKQVGFLLRRATQRHLALFADQIRNLTPTQFAALAKLCEMGPTSQNALGRATAMDAATIKGVIDRLRKKGMVASTRGIEDQRRIIVEITAAGRAQFEQDRIKAHAITANTLSPLSAKEQKRFLVMLARLS